MARASGRGLILGLLLLTACGGGGGGGGGGGPSGGGEASKPAAQILKDTVAALRGAESVHLSGEIPTGTDTFGMDLHYNRSGNLQGTITVGTVTADVVVTGGKTYLRGRTLFAKYGGDQAAAVIGDHWVSVPGSSGPGSDIIDGLATFTDFGKLADLFSTPTGGAVTKGATSTVDGTAAVALRDSDSVLYVATTGKAYPVALKPDSGSKGLHFASWDQAVDVSAPRDALDFSALSAGSPAASSSP